MLGRPFLQLAPPCGLWRSMRCTTVRNALLSCGWSGPLQGGELPHLRLLLLARGVKLTQSPGVIASQHSRLDQFHGSVGFWAKCWALRCRCVAAISDDCSLMNSKGPTPDENSTRLILPLIQTTCDNASYRTHFVIEAFQINFPWQSILW